VKEGQTQGNDSLMFLPYVVLFLLMFMMKGETMKESSIERL
jgi:hypothetical protein